MYRSNKYSENSVFFYPFSWFQDQTKVTKLVWQVTYYTKQSLAVRKVKNVEPRLYPQLFKLAITWTERHNSVVNQLLSTVRSSVWYLASCVTLQHKIKATKEVKLLSSLLYPLAKTKYKTALGWAVKRPARKAPAESHLLLLAKSCFSTVQWTLG